MIGAAFVAAAAVPQLRAGEFDKKTIMTFSAPFEISGETLPAGTNVFKIAVDNRDIVIVTNPEENHVFGAFRTIPVETMNAPVKVRVTFSENPANTPESIHSWFYPGDNYGWEFLTPKAAKSTVKNPSQNAD
jgi:hypothetical protein